MKKDPYSYETLPASSFEEEKTPSEDFILRLQIKQHQFIKSMLKISEEKQCEVLALGECVLNKDTGVITLSNFHIPKQVGTSTHCELSKEAMAQLIMKGQKVNVWIHTHPDMGAFWSSEDESTSRTLCGKCDYSLAIVIGTGDMIKIRLDINSPVNFTFDVDYELDTPESSAVLKEVEEAWKANVKKESFVSRLVGKTKGYSGRDFNSYYPPRGGYGDYDSELGYGGKFGEFAKTGRRV